ncbi:uncharacterized protein TNCV_1552121 [Trichonephila clavipes]|nr:uncharacterized protein TNCV_1552121 [Trichonephila clavipes]
MNDGAPAHFSIVVRNHLFATYPGRWIEHDKPVARPPCSLDINPLDFFFRSDMKSIVHETRVASVEDLTARSSAEIESTPELFERVQ